MEAEVYYMPKDVVAAEIEKGLRCRTCREIVEECHCTEQPHLPYLDNGEDIILFSNKL